MGDKLLLADAIEQSTLTPHEMAKKLQKECSAAMQAIRDADADYNAMIKTDYSPLVWQVVHGRAKDTRTVAKAALKALKDFQEEHPETVEVKPAASSGTTPASDHNKAQAAVQTAPPAPVVATDPQQVPTTAATIDPTESQDPVQIESTASSNNADTIEANQPHAPDETIKAEPVPAVIADAQQEPTTASPSAAVANATATTTLATAVQAAVLAALMTPKTQAAVPTKSLPVPAVVSDAPHERPASATIDHTEVKDTIPLVIADPPTDVSPSAIKGSGIVRQLSQEEIRLKEENNVLRELSESYKRHAEEMNALAKMLLQQKPQEQDQYSPTKKTGKYTETDPYADLVGDDWTVL